MFKEIEDQLLHIISVDPIEKVAFSPNKVIGKTCELIYDIKFDDIERVYIDDPDKDYKIGVITVIIKGNDDMFFDTIVIGGKVYQIIFIYTEQLDMSETNAKQLCDIITNYAVLRINILMDTYMTNYSSSMNKIFTRALVIIVCAMMKKIYTGDLLPKIIFKCLCEAMKTLEDRFNSDGVTSIFKLLDEGLTVYELLDNRLICAIKNDDPAYPGLWENNKKEK